MVPTCARKLKGESASRPGLLGERALGCEGARVWFGVSGLWAHNSPKGFRVGGFRGLGV